MAVRTQDRRKVAKPQTAKIYTKKHGVKKISREAFERKVNELSFQYYMERGVETGSAMDDWLRAENDLLKRYKLP